MSGSDRNHVLAIGAGLAAAIVALGAGSFTTSLYRDESDQQRAIAADDNGNASNSRPQQYLTTRAGIPAAIESRISNPQPGTGQDHEKRDLAAQEASATFA